MIKKGILLENQYINLKYYISYKQNLIRTYLLKICDKIKTSCKRTLKFKKNSFYWLFERNEPIEDEK
jgi:hypothetical protein